MQVSKKLYIDNDVKYRKWTIWKLRKNKKVKNIYCIVMINNNNYFLEIIKGNKVTSKYCENTLIGIATTKENTFALLARIFEEVYAPNPNIDHMKTYFK